LYYYRARYYHPQLARFVAEDPIGLAGGINLYAYVRGNPLGAIDPLGLDAIVTASGNDVHITIPIQYSGAGASPAVIDKFNNAIEAAWSGQFGQYNVTTEVTTGSMNKITVPKGDGRAEVQGTNRGTWPAERPGWTAAHEAGHLMRLWDTYDYGTGRAREGWAGNIMAEQNGKVDERNIRAIIWAAQRKRPFSHEPCY
jgi:uncharacterized protein RhaS with RHS repeats